MFLSCGWRAKKNILGVLNGSLVGGGKSLFYFFKGGNLKKNLGNPDLFCRCLGMWTYQTLIKTILSSGLFAMVFKNVLCLDTKTNQTNWKYIIWQNLKNI